MAQASVTLQKGKGRSMKAGGLWIYDNEIARTDGEFQDGDILRVLDHDGTPLGQGYINRRSKLRVRMMTRDPEAVVDRSFLYRRVKDAWEYRKRTVDTASCRLLFGEADFLPGFTADKFSDVIVVQSNALGIDRFKATLVELIREVLLQDGIRVRGVFERSDAKVRELEGMERIRAFLSEPFDTKVEIVENGVRFLVDVKEGQKTGFFLDQKYNRLAIRPLCPGARVLDCFTHTGSFALNAAFGGAAQVTGVDVSDLGIAQARENAALNGFGEEKVNFLCADVFDLLPELEKQGEQYDLIVLDPPAFTKSRSATKGAARGYKEINLRAMRLLRDGGFLATCSCSHFMTPELFSRAVAEAARDAHKRLRQVEYRSQAPDHPILWGAEDTGYLKFYIFQVTDEK